MCLLRGARVRLVAALVGFVLFAPSATHYCPSESAAFVPVRLSPAAPNSAVPVATGTGEQHAPAVSAGGSGFLAAWETCIDCRALGADIALRVLGSDGVPAGPERVLAGTSADERWPSISYNPAIDEYLVVWSLRYAGSADRFAVRARRISSAGELLGDTITIAEVDGVWPAAVVSSRGAWHGYDVAWSELGPDPEKPATVIVSRHVGFEGEPYPERWGLSGAEYEALRPIASRSSRASGTLVAWFAFLPGALVSGSSLRGVSIGASGRPTSVSRELWPAPVCRASVSDQEGRPEMLLVVTMCDPSSEDPEDGPVRAVRLNRSGDVIGEPVALGISASELSVAATSGTAYLLALSGSGPLPEASDPERGADRARRGGLGPTALQPRLSAEALLSARRLDGAGRQIGAPVALGPGHSPAAAGGSAGTDVVLCVSQGDDGSADVFAHAVAGREPSPTPTPRPDPTSLPTALTPTSAAFLPFAGR